MGSLEVSVITTVFNEGASIEAFLDSLVHQTLQADEIVVVDAGSTDGTLERLEAAAEVDDRIRVIVEPGNRSHGRNTAIEAATHEIVACTDGGGVADPEWLQHLVAPFADGADWVAGFYRVDAPSTLDRCVGLTITYVIEEVNPDFFMPSGRSMAFTKTAWKAAGGFPEDVEFGEDTLFDEMMLNAGYLPVFAADATVAWRPPSGFEGLARTTLPVGERRRCRSPPRRLLQAHARRLRRCRCARRRSAVHQAEAPPPCRPPDRPTDVEVDPFQTPARGQPGEVCVSSRRPG